MAAAAANENSPSKTTVTSRTIHFLPIFPFFFLNTKKMINEVQENHVYKHFIILLDREGERERYAGPNIQF